MGQRYVIAVKREKRELVSADWVERLSLVEGVTVAGASSGRAVIECEPIARSEIERIYGDLVHIEPVIDHETSEQTIGHETSEPEADEPKVP